MVRYGINTAKSVVTRNSLGAYGELYAARLLRGIDTIARATIAHKRYSGDIRAITVNGSILRIEVKTATLAKDKRYHFTLKKYTGTHCNTDCKYTDFVILLCVIDTALVIPFVIPTNEIIGLRAIAITRNPALYAGKYARYRGAWGLIQ